MFHHVVMLSFDGSADAAHVARIVDALGDLPSRIEELRSCQVRRDHGLAADNAQLIVLASFDDAAGYEVYRDHEDHRRVIDELIGPVLSGRTAMQFESPT